MFEFLLIIHILAAATWLGATSVRMVVDKYVQRKGGTGASAWYGAVPLVARWLKMPSAIFLLLTGFWMMGIEERFSYGAWGFWGGLTGLVVGVLLGMAIIGPQTRTAASAFERGDDQAGRKAATRALAATRVENLLLAFAVVAMVIGMD